MGVKSEVLSRLEQNRGRYLSGSELASAISVSRNAVWKAVRSLQEEGHRICAVTNKGYCLEEESAVLSKESIEAFLGKGAEALQIEVYPEVTSTNTLLKQRGEEGAPEGLVIAADRQTLGKGRSGRSFYSPADTGVYFSILLRPEYTPAEALMITTAAAVAVAKGIRKVTGIETGIKWVNDVFCGGKKICGILTEASMDFETEGLAYAVLGIGINVNDPAEGFPAELAGTAGSLYGKETCPGAVRSKLVGVILTIFMEYYRELNQKRFMEDYRRLSIVIGKEVEIYGETDSRIVTVTDIDQTGRLIIRGPDGKERAMSSGEIRIRPLQ